MFASNLLCLDIGEGLLSLVNEAESRARETVHQAEEELEGRVIIIQAPHLCTNQPLEITLIIIPQFFNACIRVSRHLRYLPTCIRMYMYMYVQTTCTR